MDKDIKRPPFRAEHVGSFPRPGRLLMARQDYSEGKIAKEDLKHTVADCIREIVALQERVGIGAVTDGEFPKRAGMNFCSKNATDSIREGPYRISNSGFSTERNSNIRVNRGSSGSSRAANRCQLTTFLSCAI
jgi:5-methyltetrahydropteroyltriglutamate--homocysteine methyltransferase